jgi:Domain of unknown function (DUF397)
MSTVDLSGVAWRKSSRSGNGDNGNCVEVGFLDASAWRKSSRSGNGGNSNCVEVAFVGPAVAVRDSKRPDGGVLVVPAAGWRGFLSGTHRPGAPACR